MKRLLPLLFLSASLVYAEDFVTLDGKEYKNVTNLKVTPDGLSGTGAAGAVNVKFTDLPLETRQKFNYDPYEAAFYRARGNFASKLTLASAFRLSQLEEAKQKAIKEKKPLGFVLVWDVLFEDPGVPMGQTSFNALAHFYQVFNDNMVLVFVRHEDELANVPESVKKGFLGPDEGGFSPNLCVVSPDAGEFICEIPMGGGKSTGATREQIFRDKVKAISAYQVAHPATLAP